MLTILTHGHKELHDKAMALGKIADLPKNKVNMLIEIPLYDFIFYGINDVGHRHICHHLKDISRNMHDLDL